MKSEQRTSRDLFVGDLSLQRTLERYNQSVNSPILFVERRFVIRMVTVLYIIVTILPIVSRFYTVSDYPPQFIASIILTAFAYQQYFRILLASLPIQIGILSDLNGRRTDIARHYA